MKAALVSLSAWIALSAWAQQPFLETDSLAPYVPTPQEVVERMLEAAHLRPGETVYDLGCGDGRVVITAAQKFKAKAVGVEIKDFLVRSTSRKVQALGLTESVQIVHGNALNTDLSKADVVTMYLLTRSNDLLRPNFEKWLKPGARVVSYEYPVRGWEPVRTEVVEIQKIAHKIYVYEIPQSVPKGAKSAK